jgi:hypothetical protein
MIRPMRKSFSAKRAGRDASAMGPPVDETIRVCREFPYPGSQEDEAQRLRSAGLPVHMKSWYARRSQSLAFHEFPVAVGAVPCRALPT